MTKFHISLSPQRRDDPLTLEKRGEVLVINGVGCDLHSNLAAEAAREWLVSPPRLEGDTWRLSIILPLGPAAPHASRFPSPIWVDEDGVIELPTYGPVVQMRHVDGIADKFRQPAPQRFTKARPAPPLTNYLLDPSALDVIPGSRYAITDCIAYWAQTEHILSCLLLECGVQSDDDAEARASKKGDFIAVELRQLAEATGNEELTEKCNRFISRWQEVKRNRNLFAHGAWALSSEFQDRVLLASSNAAVSGMQELGSRDIFTFEGLSMKYEVWCAQDFDKASKAASYLRNEAFALAAALSNAKQPGGLGSGE